MTMADTKEEGTMSDNGMGFSDKCSLYSFGAKVIKSEETDDDEAPE
jgi:hypothetical protein